MNHDSNQDMMAAFYYLRAIKIMSYTHVMVYKDFALVTSFAGPKNWCKNTDFFKC